MSYAFNNKLNDVAQACHYSFNGENANSTQYNYYLTSRAEQP